MTPVTRRSAASIRARLLARARREGIQFQRILVRYASERLLYRLSISPATDRFILKGALLFDLWYASGLRPTRDIDPKHVDATTDADIAAHKAEDDEAAKRDAARYVRRVRRRLGFSQSEFAERIDVSLDTIRNWEQGKRCPTGAAKALLKVLDKAPEAALAALR